jgi:hypothetical protein
MALAFAHPARAEDAHDPTYQVSATDAVLVVGTKGKASVTIVARKGWHLNPEAPFALKLEGAPGLLIDKTKLGRSDLASSTATQARFDVGMTAVEPGHKEVEAETSFVLCEESACRPVKERLTLRVDAKTAH